MQLWVVISFFLAVEGALSMALPARGEQQDPSGQTTQMPGVTGRWMSCAETYGKGWETCGGQNSRSCYSPALGQSCCDVDNNYCEKGTWCAPVAGYCCLDSEDLETCARNAGFELPYNEKLGDL